MCQIRNITIILLMFIIFQPLAAQNQLAEVENKFKEYINNVVEKVQEAENPEEKRIILNKSFNKMFKALDTVEKLPSRTQEELTFIASFRKKFETYQAELNGMNGFEPLPDTELNNFAQYLQQDLEQAEKNITISLTTLLLVIIIIILLV